MPFPRRFTPCSFVRLYVSAAGLMIFGLSPDPVSSARPSCPPGQFRDVASVPTAGRCTPCSSCPINHIVRRPCSRQNDTVCGPFYEFEFSHQPRNNGTSASYSLGNRTYLSKLGYRLGDGYVQSADDSVVSSATTTPRSPEDAEEEAVTVRCGQPQWRMLCYGLVATLVVIVSVALTFFALFTYCRTSVKTVRLDETSAAVAGRWEVNDDDSSTIVVNRDVRHLEEQLIHNQRRKALLRWLFGSASAADRLFSSNDYLDERHRRRFIRMLGGSTGGGGGDAPLPLEPYPGMTLTGRTTSTTDRSPIQPDSGEDTASARGITGGLDLREECDSVEETQVEDQNVMAAERGLLILHEARLQTGTN